MAVTGSKVPLFAAQCVSYGTDLLEGVTVAQVIFRK